MNLIDLYNNINKNLHCNKLKDSKNIMDKYLLCSNLNDYLQYIDCNEKYNENNYCRIKLKEFSNDNIEFILILWKPNAQTRIHDHPKNGCLMKVLSGELHEILYNKNKEKINENKLTSEYSSYIEGNNIIHKIINNTDTTAISLHIYSPPNHISNVY